MSCYTRWKLQPWCHAKMLLWCTKTTGSPELPSGCILCQNLLSVWSWTALIAQLLSVFSERLMSSIWWLNERCWIWLSLGKTFFWLYVKVEGITCWSTDDFRWKRRFIQGCYMTHFSILCSNLLNKICGGKNSLFQNVIFLLKTSALNIGVPF